MFKPSILVTNDVKLSGKQLDVYNFLIDEAYKQLLTDVNKEFFKYHLEDIQAIAPRLNSLNKVNDFFKEIMDLDFCFNILGKDKSIESRVTSKFISSIKLNKDSTIELFLEPFSVSAMRTMVKKKLGLIDENTQLNPYANIPRLTQLGITFYPAKVIYELIKDYRNSPIPKIETSTFKEITHTIGKYKDTYNKKVLQKIVEILNEKFEDLNLKIEFEKVGRVNKYVVITSDWNKPRETFEQYYERFLKDSKMKDSQKAKTMASRFYRG